MIHVPMNMPDSNHEYGYATCADDRRRTDLEKRVRPLTEACLFRINGKCGHGCSVWEGARCPGVCAFYRPDSPTRRDTRNAMDKHSGGHKWHSHQ